MHANQLCATLFLLALIPLSAPQSARAQGYAYLTQWGSYGSGIGQFNHPVGVATDAAGNVFVADQGNHRIQKFSGTGAYLGAWPIEGGDGHVSLLTGVATDAAGNVFVADYEMTLHRILKFSGTGARLDAWYGSANPSFGWSLPFVHAFGVATNAAGEVYVADAGNGYIHKFPGSGAYPLNVGCCGFAGDPIGVAADAADNVYVIDSGGSVRKFTGSLTYLTGWGSYGSGNGQFIQPNLAATDAAGDVYVADTGNNRIQKFSGTGTYITQWGSFGSGNGQFDQPVGVATNAAGEVYVTDSGNNRVQKFGPAPTPAARQTWGGVKTKYRPEGIAEHYPRH